MTLPAPTWLHIEEPTLRRRHEPMYGNLQPHHLGKLAHSIVAGEVAVHHHCPIKTTLGSCIAVCLFDPHSRLIGMNHFMVPLRHRKDDLDGYFSGMASMEVLVNAMMKAGALKHHLLAKAFGGGDVLDMNQRPTVGQANIEFTETWLRNEKIPLVASDLGGKWARQVIFEPSTGDVFCRRFSANATRSRELGKAELQYAAQLQQTQRVTKIDYF